MIFIGQVIKRQGGKLSSEMAQHYTKLATDCAGARVTSNNPEVASRITNGVLQLGSSINNITTAAANCVPNDDYSVRTLTEAGSDIIEKVISFT